MAWKGRDAIIAGLGIPHKDMCPLIKTYSKFSGQKSLLKTLKFSSKRLVDEVVGFQDPGANANFTLHPHDTH